MRSVKPSSTTRQVRFLTGALAVKKEPIPGSSSGRTHGSDPYNGGSNPSPGTQAMFKGPRNRNLDGLERALQNKISYHGVVGEAA